MRDVFERHGPRAQQARVGLLTAMGFDYGPGRRRRDRAARGGSAATAVEVGYFADGSPQRRHAGDRGRRGARAGLPPSGRRGGRRARRGAPGDLRAARRPARGRREHRLDRGARAAPGAPVAARRRRPPRGVRGASRAMQGVSALIAAAARVPGLERGLGAAAGRLVKGSTGGPDAAARARASTTVVARALGRAGSASRRCASRAATPTTSRRGCSPGRRSGSPPGAAGLRGAGPVDAFGLDAAEAGTAESGIARAG